jgi:hypothetical protein
MRSEDLDVKFIGQLSTLIICKVYMRVRLRFLIVNKQIQIQTLTPAARSLRTSQTPDLRLKFELGQWDTPASVLLPREHAQYKHKQGLGSKVFLRFFHGTQHNIGSTSLKICKIV